LDYHGPERVCEEVWEQSLELYDIPSEEEIAGIPDSNAEDDEEEEINLEDMDKEDEEEMEVDDEVRPEGEQ
jgi:hypothetical protein